MSKYFKIIGVIELIAFAIGIIPLFIYMADAIKQASAVGGSTGAIATGLVVFIYIFLMLIYLFMGPAIGLAFLYLGKLAENDSLPRYSKPNPSTYYRAAQPAVPTPTVVTNSESGPKPKLTETVDLKLSLGEAVRVKVDLLYNGIVINKGSYGMVYDKEYTNTPIILFRKSGKEIKIPVPKEELDY